MVMSLDEFISRIEEEFEDLEPGTIKADSKYKQAINWTSMNALIFIIMIDAEFGVILKDEEFSENESIAELYSRINAK